LLVSSGKYGSSKTLLLDYDFEACSFDEIFSENMDPAYFAEGATVAMDNTVY